VFRAGARLSGGPAAHDPTGRIASSLQLGSHPVRGKRGTSSCGMVCSGGRAARKPQRAVVVVRGPVSMRASSLHLCFSRLPARRGVPTPPPPWPLARPLACAALARSPSSRLCDGTHARGNPPAVPARRSPSGRRRRSAGSRPGRPQRRLRAAAEPRLAWPVERRESSPPAAHIASVTAARRHGPDQREPEHRRPGRRHVGAARVQARTRVERWRGPASWRTRSRGRRRNASA